MHDFKAVYDFVHYMDSYLKVKRENNFRTDLRETTLGEMFFKN